MSGEVINHQCEIEWPSLGSGESGESGGGGGQQQMQILQPEQPSGGGDWEIISTSSDDEGKEEEKEGGSGDNDNDNGGPQQQEEAVTIRVNPKILHHSASSPDLRAFHHQLEIIAERSHDGNNSRDSGDDDDDDFFTTGDYSLVSGPPSVISMSSNTVGSSAWGANTGGFSFRDAILKSKPATTTTPQPQDGQEQEGKTAQPQKQQRRRMIQPKFVVTKPSLRKMRRCSHSTGDLQSLATLAEQQEEEDYYGGGGGGGGEAICGDTDAMEFYHRKALGAKGRANGLKLRPDEAKRKEFTIQKKEMQRQAQQQQQRCGGR